MGGQEVRGGRVATAEVRVLVNLLLVVSRLQLVSGLQLVSFSVDVEIAPAAAAATPSVDACALNSCPSLATTSTTAAAAAAAAAATAAATTVLVA